MRVAAAQESVSSRLIDNLSASDHLGAQPTEVFALGELAGAQQPGTGPSRHPSGDASARGRFDPPGASERPMNGGAARPWLHPTRVGRNPARRLTIHPPHPKLPANPAPA